MTEQGALFDPPADAGVQHADLRGTKAGTDLHDRESFERFWNAWPANNAVYARKVAKKQCFAKWVTHCMRYEADLIVAHVEHMKSHPSWLKDGGSFIPAPLVYLNQARWDGFEIPKPKAAAPVPGPREFTDEDRRIAAEKARELKAKFGSKKVSP